MKAIVEEVAAMFPDELFFFGGDETACPYNECDYTCVIHPSRRFLLFSWVIFSVDNLDLIK